MKIVFAPHAYAPSIGGAERYTQGLAEALASVGNEIHVLVPNVDNPEAFYERGHSKAGVGWESYRGVEVHRIPYLTARYRRPGLGRLERGLASAVARYARGLDELMSAVAPNAVVTLPHLFPNVVEVFRLHDAVPWKLVYAPMLHEQDPYWSVEEVATNVKAADGIIALTQHESARLLESYGASSRTTRVVPPGVDLPSDATPIEREPMVLFIGRRSQSKRLDVLYEAMKGVWADHPEAKLVIAGPPAAGGLDPVAGSTLPIDSRVEILGALDDGAKADLYRRAMLAVNPSLAESFGISTLEAWAHSTPVVAIDSPVNRSVIQDGVNGLLTDPDAASLAVGITNLLAEPAIPASMGEAGRLRAETEFSWRSSAGALIDLLRRL